MTTTKSMELTTLTPQYLIARVETDAARRALSSAQGRLVAMEDRIERHAREVEAKSKSGLLLRTNAQVLRSGSGSGVEIVYSACSHDDSDIECLCNPRRSPWSPADLAAAQDAIEKALKTFTKAEKTLAETPPEMDAFANAREHGSRYCWWPNDRFVDPRVRRWRGQPMTSEEMTALGPHRLRAAIQAGSVIEVEQ